MSIVRTYIKYLWLFLFIVFLCSCGKKGPPTLKDMPEEKPENSISHMKVTLSLSGPGQTIR